MPQANAQDRDLPGKVLHQCDGNARFIRGTRTGGNDDLFGRDLRDLCQRDGIVAMHDELCPQFPEILHEVVREGIVIVDDENHTNAPLSASSTARNRARALFTVSWYSHSGSESNTTPPPACTYALPSLISMVRMAMHVSMLPAKSI